MKGLFQLILGLAFIVLVLITLTYDSWLWATIRLMQGGIVLFLAFMGLILVFIGFNEMKEA